MPPLSSPCQCRANLDPCALRKSDPAYRIRARMATVLGTHGSVLIIEPTKMPAQRTAAARAEELDEDDPACAALVALATTRLRTAHPLVGVLRRGVGFHHAALPGDIQAELEDGIRRARSATSWLRQLSSKASTFPCAAYLSVIAATRAPTATSPPWTRRSY